MSTGQMYVGKGNNVPSTEQTAKKAVLTVENRPIPIWKPFPRLGHLYLVSNFGEVRNLQTGLPIATYFCDGQEMVVLERKTNRRSRYLVSEAVALAFVPNPNGYPTVLPIDASQPLTYADNLKWGTRRGSCRGVRTFTVSSTSPLIQPYSEYLLDRLLVENRISQTERFQSGIFTAPDDCMSATMPESVRFIATKVEPSRYQSLVGKVVQVVVKAERFAFYLGRVVSITPNSVRVSRDNKEWSDRIESRSVIAGIARVVSVLETPVN